MRLLAFVPLSGPAAQRQKGVRTAAFAQRNPIQKQRPVCRYVLVEDLEHLYRTGQTRQVLEMRWTR